MDFLQGLNPQQREAVAHVEGPLLILAGAGSGKTRVITHRIGHLIRAHGVYPPSVLAVTFTNKASQEMRDRIGKLVGEVDRDRLPRVSTFHSFCVRLLRRDGDRLADIRHGFTRTFNIYDADDQLALIKQIFKALGLDEKFMQYRAALSRISSAKNSGETPDDFHKNAADPKMGRLGVVFERYEHGLRQNNALDFDDLLLESVRLLKHDALVRDNHNRFTQYLMIDEYQDTNRSQYELMRLLTTERQNVCVVGDEDQSIYSWRGADIRNILDFEKDFPKAKVIRLEQNYRSTKNILDAAGAVVARNTQRKGKNLWTDSGSGSKIGLYEALDAENEALYIADSIERLLREDRKSQVAVLYRTNFQSRQIEEALRRYGRKYTVVGGFSFYQRAEVKDILSYLKAAVQPTDSIALLRIINIPARGIGKTTIDEVNGFASQNGITAWAAVEQMLEGKRFAARAEAALTVFMRMMRELHAAAQTKPPHDLLTLILNRSGYLDMLKTSKDPDSETRVENLSELVNAAAEAAERGETVIEYLDHAALVADSDGIDEEAQVLLLTMHNAKGLEFPAVFLAGLEEGLFPHSRSLESATAIEEERRLCYVGMTRARQQLTLSWAKSRRKYGGGPSEPTIKSRFLDEVPRSLLERVGPAGVPSRQVDLYSERHEVRETVKKNLYTGKTYNSLENIAQFFEDRGVKAPPPAPPAQQSFGGMHTAPSPPPNPARPPLGAVGTYTPKAFGPPKPKAPGGKRSIVGIVVNHPKYGRGTVLKQEGEGDEAKITVNFAGHGLKKLIAKYSGIELD